MTRSQVLLAHIREQQALLEATGNRLLQLLLVLGPDVVRKKMAREFVPLAEHIQAMWRDYAIAREREAQMSKQTVEYTRTVRQQVIRSRVDQVEAYRPYASRNGLYEVDTYVDGDLMARMRAKGMLDDLDSGAVERVLV